MSLTDLTVKRSIAVGWVVTAMTLVSIAISVGIVVAVLTLLLGTDSTRMITAGEFWTLALAFATGIPAIACPLVGTRMLFLLRDLNAAKDELARIADTDQLTGLLNRRGFEKAASQVLAQAERDGQPVAVMMCDIDHFKSINDTHGHDFGDLSIKHVADVIIQTLAGRGAIAGRFGGEEFVLLLPNYATGAAKLAADELRLACALQHVAFEGKSARVTMSVGVAGALKVESDLGRLISHADTALYRAKRSGRNRVVADQVETMAKVA